MSEDGPGARAYAARVLLAATLGVLGLFPSVGAAADLPVSLIDPTGGGEVLLEAGPAVLHVVFFATWCPPCVDEMDALAQLEARWHGRGYRLVLVGVKNRQDRERLIRFDAERRPPGRILFDAAGGAEKKLRVSELPTHLVFDAQGRERLRAASYGSRVDEVVQELLEEPQP